MVHATSTEQPPKSEAQLSLQQDGAALHWRLENGAEARWYFLPIPTVVDGETSYAFDSALAKQQHILRSEALSWSRASGG